MKFRMNIKAKMLIYILSTTVLISAISVGYINYNTRKLVLRDAEKIAQKVVDANALTIEKNLSEDMSTVNTLSNCFSTFDEYNPDIWQDMYGKMARRLFDNRQNFFGWTYSIETQYYDTAWDGVPQRYFYHLERNDDGSVSQNTAIKDLSSEIYQFAKNVNEDALLVPEYSDKEKLMKSYIISPVKRNEEYVGYVVADIASYRFKETVKKIAPWEQTGVFLTTNDGRLLWYQDDDYYGKKIFDYHPEYETSFDLSKYIVNGTKGVFWGQDSSGRDILLAISPIQVGDYVAPWSLILVVPKKVILKEANKTQAVSLIVAIIGIILISVVIYFISTRISNSIVRITDILKKLTKGDTDNIDELTIKRGDEIEEMVNSVNALRSGLISTSEFAKEIGQNNLDAEFIPLSDKDILGNSLLNMRQSLKHAKEEEEKRKIEDEKQKWVTQGLAKFGEILRTNANNLEELTFNIMSNLIKYLDVNQGAIFIINDTKEDDVFLEMKSAIAYERHKYMHKKVGIGEGLVGRCAFEKKTIYMTDLPDDYINITSGMGTANPKTLLLAPLILNEDIFGVIELASFHDIEKYQIEFVEKLGESIAGTIATVKVNEKTTNLLEQSKTQSEELAAQEEEMRQNLEELQATQEEAARREREMAAIVEAFGTTAFIIEYDVDGAILRVNEKYARFFGVSQDELIGRNHADAYQFTDREKEEYNKFWEDLRRGITKKEESRLVFNKKEFWLEESYIPILNKTDNTVYKILKVGFDITEQKKREQLIEEEKKQIEEFKKRIEALEKQLVENNNEKAVSVEKKEEPKQDEVKQNKVSDVEIKATGSNLIDWVDKYLLGIDEIDEQHKQLVELINTLNASVINNKNKKEIKDNLRSFIDFAAYHFGNEENYFDKFGYDKAKEHTEDHNKFLKEVKRYQKEYNTNKVKTLTGVLVYIKEWLYSHFTNIDTEYIDVFKSNGL